MKKIFIVIVVLVLLLSACSLPAFGQISAPQPPANVPLPTPTLLVVSDELPSVPTVVVAPIAPAWVELGTNESSNPVFPDWRDLSKSIISHTVTDGEQIITIHSDPGTVYLERNGDVKWTRTFPINDGSDVNGMFVVIEVLPGDVVSVQTEFHNNGHFGFSANTGYCEGVSITMCSNAWFGRIQGIGINGAGAIVSAHLVFEADSRTSQDPKPWAVYVNLDGIETVIAQP